MVPPAVTEQATAYILVGLPGSGKTTRASELEHRHKALRFTPDEWMKPLFGVPEADGRRDILEGRCIKLGLDALRIGVDVVFDFGVWTKVERSALRALVAGSEARSELVYMAVDKAERRERLRRRTAEGQGLHFEISEQRLAAFDAVFEAPTESELYATTIDPAPSRYETWEQWAAQRWPTSTT